MKHILYLSRAVYHLSDQDLHDLLAQSCRDNARRGITGILFYSHGRIAQLFEGEDAIADTLFARIMVDAWHTHVVKHIDKPIEYRSFTDWAMAFHPQDPQQLQQFAGRISPAELRLEQPNLTQADQLLLQLLRSFVLP